METRKPITGSVTRVQRVGYAYEQARTASIFMFTEPLAAWLEATAQESCTMQDWADEVAQLLKSKYRTYERLDLVCNDFNPHTQ